MYQIKIRNTVDLVKEAATFDPDTFEELTPAVLKTEEEIAAEEQALIDTKAAEIQAEVDTYKQAQENQRQNGGPGPVAEFEIMKIANEYNGQFEVIFEEE